MRHCFIFSPHSRQQTMELQYRLGQPCVMVWRTDCLCGLLTTKVLQKALNAVHQCDGQDSVRAEGGEGDLYMYFGLQNSELCTCNPELQHMNCDTCMQVA